VADEIARTGFTGLFVESNAINPARMNGIAARLRAGGATAVDAAIIGPPPGLAHGVEHRARLYLSGPSVAVDTVWQLFSGSLAEPRRMDDRIGSASALKMAYGSFQKTSRALAAVSHALADDFGVTAHLIAEARTSSGNALADRGQFGGVAAVGWRWAPEMDEVAESLRSARLPDALATGAAHVLRHWDADKDDYGLAPDTALDHLRLRPPD
jgi:hypothetical protein